MKLLRKILMHLSFAAIGLILNTLFRPAFLYFLDTTYALVTMLFSLSLTLVLPIVLTMYYLKASNYKQHLINGILTVLFVSVFKEMIHRVNLINWFDIFFSISFRVLLGTIISSILALFFPKKVNAKMDTRSEVLDG